MRVEDLNVYKKLCDLHLEVHDVSLQFPKFELFEFGAQIRRSSNSAPANLAEGFGNKHTAIFTECISRSQGEIRETKHHLLIAHRKKYITKEKYTDLYKRYEECSKMLYGLENSLIRKKI
jgi:four helix bundle protein